MRANQAAGIVYEGREVVANRRLNAISIAIPAIGTLAALGAAFVWLPTWTTLGVFTLFFVLQLLGISAGLHRYFTHRAFKTGRAIHTFLAVTASWAFQGPIDRWVADHRRHHRFADQEFDPHSPHWIHEKPAQSRLAGLYHAHVGWMLTGDFSCQDRYASDIQRDTVTRWCSDHYWWLSASSIALPGLLGLALGGWAEAALCALWGGFARVVALQQLTWTVNSIGHSFGSQVAGSRDESRDIPILAILLFGDGLHSYHHRYPAAAVNEPIGLDLNGMLLTGLEKAGLVWDLRRFGEPTELTTDAEAASAR